MNVLFKCCSNNTWTDTRKSDRKSNKRSYFTPQIQEGYQIQVSQLNLSPVTPVMGVTSKCYDCQSASTSRSISLSNANKRTTFCTSYWVNYRLLVALAIYLSSVLVVEVNSLFADQRMTEQLLRISATLTYGRHIEFINLNPGLSQTSSFNVQNPCPMQSERPTS